MKKLILIGIAAISIMASADVNTKKILEEYRKSALQEQSRKEIKEKSKKESIRKNNVDSTGVSEMPAEDENSANADVVESGTQATADVIEKVNFYLRNNPEKLQKLEKHYRAVVGQE